MKFPAVAVAVLSLLSVGLSAPVIDCEDLTRAIEIENREQLLGNWTTLAESTNLKGSQLITKLFVDNNWVKVSAATEVDGLEIVQYQKMMGACFTLKMNMTLAKNTLTSENPLVVTETLLFTSCPDCLVINARYSTPSSVLSGLQFLSRRRRVTDAEMEEFKKQVQCLDLSAPAVLNPETVLCPDDSQSQGGISIDLSDTMNTERERVVELVDELLTGGTDIKDLIKPITGNAFDEKAK